MGGLEKVEWLKWKGGRKRQSEGKRMRGREKKRCRGSNVISKGEMKGNKGASEGGKRQIGKQRLETEGVNMVRRLLHLCSTFFIMYFRLKQYFAHIMSHNVANNVLATKHKCRRVHHKSTDLRSCPRASWPAGHDLIQTWHFNRRKPLFNFYMHEKDKQKHSVQSGVKVKIL